MTNNPTIDGVSRELTEAMSYYFGRDEVANFKLYLRREFQSLDKPVEPDKCKHEFIYFGRSDLPRKCRHCNEPEPVGLPCRKSSVETFSTYGLGECAGLNACLDAVAPEVAALQSTIAQLQARVSELEGAMGEPVAWLDLEKVSHGMAYATNSKINDRQTGLFTAPQAPVAVVLPERKPEPTTAQIVDPDCNYATGIVEGWNTCLDATAALNGEQK